VGGIATREHNIRVDYLDGDCAFWLLLQLMPFHGKCFRDLNSCCLLDTDEYDSSHAGLISFYKCAVLRLGGLKGRLARTNPRHTFNVALSEDLIQLMSDKDCERLYHRQVNPI
jgi:hypothetical protein